MPLTRIKTKGLGTSVTFENITDTGTEGTKVATGTTAQRGSTEGELRFNTTTGKFEGRNAVGNFVTIEATPTVTNVDVTEVDSQAGGNQTFVITGTNFFSGAIASFVGNDGTIVTASTTTVNSTTQITAVAAKSDFASAKEPYDVKITSTAGLAGQLDNQVNIDSSPVWTTSAGSLGEIQESATGNHFTIAATDADGDTIAYTETGGTNISGAGLTLNSSTGVISGDPTDVNADTTVSFTARATAGSKTTDRAFSLIVKDSFAWDILGGISSSGGNAMNSSASYIQAFFDPADTRSYSGSGTNITNMAWALGSDNQKSGGQTWTMTNLTTGGSGNGKYFINSNNSATHYIRAPGNPTATWSNGSNDQLAFCGWWYLKTDIDSTGELWIFNDGDWGPNGQVGIRLQSGQIRTLRGSSNNIAENLPSGSGYTNNWWFFCAYMGARGGYYSGLASNNATNLTDIVTGGHTYNTGTATPQPFTIGARPDSLSSYNPANTRMGFQAVWGSNDDAFLNSSGNYANTDGKAIFEQIFDQTKGFYS